METDLITEVAEYFSDHGKLQDILEGYEYRESQFKMAKAVSDFLVNKKNYIIEAPTGIGKTAAYLLPSILFVENNQKVIISTNTINLQEQLFNADLPMLKRFISPHLKFAVLMGRNNYICMNKFERLLNLNPLLLKTIRKWLDSTTTGTRSDMPIAMSRWSEIASESSTCFGKKCRFFKSECFYYKAKKKAMSANIIITNHHLTILDIMQPEGRKVLPAHKFTIWDEAHHIAEVATSHIGDSLSTSKIGFLISSLNRKSGGILNLIKLKIDRENNKIFDLISQLNNDLIIFSDELKNVLKEYDEYGIVNNSSAIYDDFKILDSLSIAMKKTAELLKLLIKSISVMADNDESILFESMRLNFVLEKLAATDEAIKKFKLQDKQFVYYTKRMAKSVVFTMSPIDVSSFMTPVFNENNHLLTSATLSIAGDFSFVKQLIGLENFADMRLVTEFDLENQMKAFVVKEINPLNYHYSDLLSEAIKELVVKVKGGVLILFTSHSQMKDSYNKSYRFLTEHGKNAIIQGEMPRYRLFKIMHETESVLFGTNSFWEGIDIPGKSLTAVIITHLPFQSHEDPIVKARMKSYQSNGLNGFSRFMLPDMILKLRQGIGRLIRKRTDIGVIIFTDSRLINKSYGKTVRSSLPFDVDILSLSDGVKKLELFYA